METIKTLVLIGGISRESLNRRYFRAIEKRHPSGFLFKSFDISRLPFFSQDIENDPPQVVVEFKDKIKEADAILFITPEYNRSFPGVLKNAIDWGSRPYGQNHWDKKPAAILGASIGNIGTFGAQHHLRQVFAYLNMYVLGQPEMYFNATHLLSDTADFVEEKTGHLIDDFFTAFGSHIQRIKGIEEESEPLRLRSKKTEDRPHAH